MTMTVTAAGTATSTTTGTTLDVTTTVDFAPEDWIVALVGADNAGTNGAASSGTNGTFPGASPAQAAVSMTSVNRDPGAANEGVTVSYGHRVMSYPFAAGGTYRFGFNPTTPCRCVALYRLRPDPGYQVRVYSGNNQTGSATSLTTGSEVVDGAGSVVIVACAVETNTALTGDSDTTEGSWSALVSLVADTGDDLTSIRLGIQTKVTTGGSNQQNTMTLAGARDYAVRTLVYSQVLGPIGDIVEVPPRVAVHCASRW